MILQVLVIFFQLNYFIKDLLNVVFSDANAIMNIWFVVCDGENIEELLEGVHALLMAIILLNANMLRFN